MKLVIISMDLMIAIPLSLAAFYIMLVGANSIIGYQHQSSTLSSSRLRDIALSQELAVAIDFGPMNYSNAAALIHNSAIESNSTINLSGISYNETCNAVCRIVEIRNASYLLVIGNESPS